MTRFGTMLVAGAAAMALGGLTAQVNAKDAASFYKGKTVKFMVGYRAGGGYDTTTRLVARHLVNHIPGKPAVTVENMPGAGSLRLVNYIYNVAPKDGSLIGVFSSAAVLEPLLGNKSAKFDASKFTWVGSMHSDINSCGVWKGAGQNIKSFADLIKAKKNVVFGSTGPQSITSMWPLFLKNVFGAKVQVIEGYKGTKGINLAMKRGEVSALCGMFESSVRGAFFDDYKSGDLKIILQVGLDRKVPLFGDAVQITEITKDKGKEMQQIVRYVFGPAAITRPVAAPPGVPADRAKALQKALADTMADPKMVADGKSRLGVQLKPMTGDEVKNAILAFYKTPKDVIKKAISLTKKKN